jgi:hypothetical protein
MNEPTNAFCTVGMIFIPEPPIEQQTELSAIKFPALVLQMSACTHDLLCMSQKSGGQYDLTYPGSRTGRRQLLILSLEVVGC